MAGVSTSQRTVPTIARLSRQRRSAMRVAMCVVGTLLGLALVETLIRVGNLDSPLIWEPDPVLGWRHIPHARRHFTDEGDGLVEINSLGFRDRPRSREKAPDTTRIVVLGDSMTEADQVNLDETYCYLLEERLARDERRVEVLNCGRTGYTPAQELLLLRNEVWSLQPDYVIVATFLDNDVACSFPATNTGPSDVPMPVLCGNKLDFDFSRAEAGYASYRQEPNLYAAAVVGDLSIRE